MQQASGVVPRVLIKRREAAAMASISLPTLARRERLDPGIPRRIGTGPAGGAPWAYRLDEWTAYLETLPRAAPAQPPTAQARARGAELARVGVAKRRSGDAAEPLGVESKATALPTSENAPTMTQLDAGSVAATESRSNQPAGSAVQRETRRAPRRRSTD